MPGLVPGIHVFGVVRREDVDGRDKPTMTKVFLHKAGHDGKLESRQSNTTTFHCEFFLTNVRITGYEERGARLGPHPL
jgi:hypothetical protein